MSDKTTKYHSVGRFDYVEPMNLNLTDPDNMVINKPEDYSISVNLEVEIPSRFYSENNEVKLIASSDNGTLSFFGGSDVGPKTDSDAENKNRGYLTTSWTDIATTNVDKGNKECLGIESINIAYTPNFFPVVTIRFVDVRGASLFMPQEKAYQVMVKENGYDPKMPFDGASVFKALFSMPCPIFKLTVKGFYGRPVTYKLMMSKFSSEFDSENGNFIANVEFAGYMYGIYTELPMSFIALAPYIDNLDFWKKRNFKFKNGVQIPTIPDLIERIGSAQKNASQKALESAEGKKYINANNMLSVFKKLKEEFPFNEWKHIDGETDDKSKYGIGVAVNNIDKIVNNSPVLKDDSKNVLCSLNSYKGHEQQRDVFYKIVSGSDIATNGNIFCISSSDVYLSNFVIDENVINNYKTLLKNIAEEYGNTEYGNYFDKYITDFNVILEDIGFNEKIYYRNKLTNCGLPVYCLLNNSSGKETVYGIDFFNRDNKTYVIGYNGFKIGNGKDCTPSEVQTILKNCGIDKQNNKSYFVYRIATNTLRWLQEDITRIEKTLEKQKAKVKEQQSEEEEKLLQFPLTIENVYHIIFAHIEAFMTIYYYHLKNISNDNNRNVLINNAFGNLADVPKLTSKTNKIQDIPPFPTFIDKTEKEGDKITWPCNVLNRQHIEETKFVEDIIDAALQLGNKIEKAKQEIAKESNSNNYPSSTDSMIPSSILDLISDNSNYNPYSSIYEKYKKNPQENIENKIWFTFAMRCAYFGMIFKKYRRYVGGTARNRIAKKSIEKGTKSAQELIEMAHSYFAMSEACNIKKVFGDNIARKVILNLTKEEANKDFKRVLNLYITGDSNKNFGTNSLNTSQNTIWNINFNEKFNVDENHIALPVKNIDNSKIDSDIKDKKCLTSEEYIIFKDNGSITEEDIDGIILNEKFIDIKENVNYFTSLKSNIESDSVVKECSFEGLNTFLDDFLVKYLGRGIEVNDGSYMDDSNKLINPLFPIVDNSTSLPSPYILGKEQRIFTVGDDKKSYNEIKKNGESYNYDNIFLQEVINEKPIRYTSIVNGMKCVDPINVITTGSTTGNSTTHFPFETNPPEIRFLNSGATNYDKAYLFLFSLPVATAYNNAVTYANVQRVPKVCLLREGAFYYWQKNYSTMLKHFNENYGAGMMSDNIPIVNNDKTNSSLAPTLYLTNNPQQTYLTWTSKAKIPLNRKKYLIEYFKKWVDSSDEFYTIMNIKQSHTGLTNSQMSVVSKLYMTEVIYIDYSCVIERDMYHVGIEDSSSCNEECIDFFTKSYDKFRGYINLLYPVDNMLSSPPALDLTDEEIGIKANKDIKLSIYLTLQTLYNKFIAGNKLERWQLGKDESDFNNFLYMDSYFNLIGQRLVFNGTRIENMLSVVSDTVAALANSDENSYKGSVYEFFSKLCQENGCNLIALPIRPYTIKKESNSEKLVWDLFDAIPYNRIKADDSSCFVSMYTYKPSEHLDNQNDNGLYGFKQDGFNINPTNEKDLPRQFKSNNVAAAQTMGDVNINGDINDNGSSDEPMSLQRFEEEGSPRIPSFAVTYAKQNQSIFKKITVSTTNPQITEPSIAMTLNIASKSDSTPRDSVIFGQDLYSVYSNYSYTCDVEMMGCAPIMPLMYFQLNNIPMFKGAYQIIHVEHNIVAGNMTTRFKGVRVNKNAIPFVRASYVYNDYLGNRLYENDLSKESSEFQSVCYSDGKSYNYDDSTTSKERMANAFDSTFMSCSVGETKGMCARYTYRMAYTFVTGKNPCGKIAGGNAREDSFHENLKKLGYTMSDEVTFKTTKDCARFIDDSKRHFHYGDVVVYWASEKTNDENDSCVKYGHAQIYVGDSKVSPDNTSNWASSMKDNYNSPMVYRNTKSNFIDWQLQIYRQPLDKDKVNIA